MSHDERASTTNTTLALDGERPPAERLKVALGHATKSVPIAAPDQSAESVRQSLVGRTFESAADVAVLDGRELVGLISIEQLLATPDETRLADVMDTGPAIVSHGTDQKVVAWCMVHRGERSAAVVDDAGRFAGLIPPYRMLEVLLHEHDEDLARMGGYMRGTSSARRAAEEPVARRLWHRLPWLLVGLLGAMVSAVVVGAYEEQLSEVLLLTFFLPAVVYLADAVGTQTEAILIRGLSVGIEMRKVFRRELASGVVIGTVIGVAFVPFALLVWVNEQVAVAVALALFCACTIATLVAMVLPLIFQRFGVDPAFGSGPLSTVIQDLLSIVVYLAIAAPIAT